MTQSNEDKEEGVLRKEHLWGLHAELLSGRGAYYRLFPGLQPDVLLWGVRHYSVLITISYCAFFPKPPPTTCLGNLIAYCLLGFQVSSSTQLSLKQNNNNNLLPGQMVFILKYFQSRFLMAQLRPQQAIT